MAKYTEAFKLNVVHYYLSGKGYKQTTKYFDIGHETVRKWVTRYELYGVEGIRRRKHKAFYSAEFKFNAIKMVIEQGLSQKSVAAQLNLPTDAFIDKLVASYRWP